MSWMRSANTELTSAMQAAATNATWNRQVEIEHAAPRRNGEQETSNDRATGGTDRDWDQQPLRCNRALLGWECVHQHREADRRHHSAANALQDAEHDERQQALPDATQHRSTRDRDDRDQNVRLLPKRSPSQPEAGTHTAMLSRQPVTTHSIPVGDA